MVNRQTHINSFMWTVSILVLIILYSKISGCIALEKTVAQKYRVFYRRTKIAEDCSSTDSGQQVIFKWLYSPNIFLGRIKLQGPICLAMDPLERDKLGNRAEGKTGKHNFYLAVSPVFPGKLAHYNYKNKSNCCCNCFSDISLHCHQNLRVNKELQHIQSSKWVNKRGRLGRNSGVQHLL